MVRLVFRPYTQVLRSICTSEPLRASTRVSSGFALLRNSSPSFGSQRTRSTARPSENIRLGRRCPRKGYRLSLSLRVRVFHPNTRERVALLGPCFKTGRLKPLCQHPKRESGRTPALRRAAFLDPNRRMRLESITHPEVPHYPSPFPTVKIDAGPSTGKCTKQKQG